MPNKLKLDGVGVKPPAN